MADPVTKRVSTYNPNDTPPHTPSSKKNEISPPSPVMTQEKKSSSTSTSTSYPHSTSNIADDVKKILKKHTN